MTRPSTCEKCGRHVLLVYSYSDGGLIACETEAISTIQEHNGLSQIGYRKHECGEEEKSA